MKFKVVEEILETENAKTLLLESNDFIPSDFCSGQFCTFSFTVDGEECVRCYSLSCSELEARRKRVAITVKKIMGGKASSFLVDNHLTGEYISAEGPYGDFVGQKVLSKPAFLIAAGSGITPIFSIVKTWTELDSKLKYPISLLYFNSAPESTLFYDYLYKLSESCDEFWGEFIFTRSANKQISSQKLSERMIQRHLDSLGECNVAICGPASFMDEVSNICRSVGVEENLIFTEDFHQAVSSPSENAEQDAEFTVSFSCTDGVYRAALGNTVLDVAISAGVGIRSVCGVGACSECKVRITSGAVEMNHQGGISPLDEEQGYILACCSRPISNISIDTAFV